jgi:alpha-L-arabinofuranosidase
MLQYPKIIVFPQDVLDSLEFARGSANSTWGSVRAAMGHPEPFPVKYVAIGNEDCGKKYYLGNFLNYLLMQIYSALLCVLDLFVNCYSYSPREVTVIIPFVSHYRSKPSSCVVDEN